MHHHQVPPNNGGQPAADGAGEGTGPARGRVRAGEPVAADRAGEQGAGGWVRSGQPSFSLWVKASMACMLRLQHARRAAPDCVPLAMAMQGGCPCHLLSPRCARPAADVAVPCQGHPRGVEAPVPAGGRRAALHAVCGNNGARPPVRPVPVGWAGGHSKAGQPQPWLTVSLGLSHRQSCLCRQVSCGCLKDTKHCWQERWGPGSCLLPTCRWGVARRGTVATEAVVLLKRTVALAASLSFGSSAGCCRAGSEGGARHTATAQARGGHSGSVAWRNRAPLTAAGVAAPPAPCLAGQ